MVWCRIVSRNAAADDDDAADAWMRGGGGQRFRAAGGPEEVERLGRGGAGADAANRGGAEGSVELVGKNKSDGPGAGVKAGRSAVGDRTRSAERGGQRPNGPAAARQHAPTTLTLCRTGARRRARHAPHARPTHSLASLHCPAP